MSTESPWTDEDVAAVTERLVSSGRGALPYAIRVEHARLILDALAPRVAELRAERDGIEVRLNRKAAQLADTQVDRDRARDALDRVRTMAAGWTREPARSQTTTYASIGDYIVRAIDGPDEAERGEQ